MESMSMSRHTEFATATGRQLRLHVKRNSVQRQLRWLGKSGLVRGVSSRRCRGLQFPTVCSGTALRLRPVGRKKYGKIEVRRRASSKMACIIQN
eukprot:scaffold568009_cov42-Prasinocladus_malaysianus.AAC.1